MADDGDDGINRAVAGQCATHQALTLLATGEAHRASPAKTAEGALAARAPRRPEELVGALQDRIHPSSGRLLATKSVNVRRRLHAGQVHDSDDNPMKRVPFPECGHVGLDRCSSCNGWADVWRIGRFVKRICQECGHVYGLSNNDKRRLGVPVEAKKV